MALNSSAVLKVGTGVFYTGSIGASVPSDLDNPGPTFDHMGHTSLSDILNSASEGGETTTLGTLQNRNLRQTVAGRTESYNINLHQFDSDGLRLFYGANSEVTPDGHIRPAQDPVPTECSWLFVFRDGDRVGGIYAPRVAIIRGDDFNIADTESLSALNLRITPLVHEGNNYAVEFIPPHLYVPGTPPAWEAETFYDVGARITVGAGVLRVEEDGTSGATIPSLPASVGARVTDGTVRWVRLS